MKRWIAGTMVLGLLGMAGSVWAEDKVSIKEKNARIYDQEQLAESASSANTACGIKVATSIDWASFKGVQRGGNSLSGYCAAPLSALSTICSGSAAGKETIQKEIKKLVCHYGGKDKPVISVKNGTIDWTINWTMANLEDAAKEYLENNL